MAAVPQQEPAKPAKKRTPAEWLVYEVKGGNDLHGVGVREARNAEAACWLVAEGPMREQATSDEGIRLVAIKASEIEPRIYRLRSTVERVKA